MNATTQKIIPLISSGTAGTLGAHDMLADGYELCGQGFDQMTLSALGLDRDKTIAFVNEKHPSYTQFEEYVVEQNGGSLSPDKIAKHNAAITGYNHADDAAAQMRSASGNKNADTKTPSLSTRSKT